MRKLFLLLFFFSSFFLTASVNEQKIIDVSSDVNEAVKLLFISEGVNLPSYSLPWSVREIKMMLSLLDTKRFNEGERELYNYILREIDEDSQFHPFEEISISFPVEINLDLFLHTDNTLFSSPDEHSLLPGSFYGDYNLAEDVLKVPFEVYIGSNFYSYMYLSLSNVRNRQSYTTPVYSGDEISAFEYTSTVFDHNLPFVFPYSFSDFSMNFPYRAIVAAGGSWWSLTAGRERFNWGMGESGNFFLGSQVPYHNSFRFTAFTRAFKYTLLLSFYVHPQNYYSADGYFRPYFDQASERKGTKALIAHKIEFSIYKKMGISLTEAIMYQGDSFDFMTLSPSAIFHNYYTRANANSILVLDVDYAVWNNWDLYLSIAVDEFQVPGEVNEGNPNARGYMIGSKFSYPSKKKGTLYGALEFVYTDPYLYIRDGGGDRESGDVGYDNSFIIAFPEFSSAPNLSSYTPLYIGYRYGGNAIVCFLKCGYKVFGEWGLEGRFSYVCHGLYDVYTKWTNFPSGTVESNNEAQTADKDRINHTVDLSLSGFYNISEGLTVGARIDFIVEVNKGNVSGRRGSDFQATLTLNYSL